MRRLCAIALSIVLALGWLVSPLTTTAAQAAPAKPAVSPGHPVRGVAFSVSGKLPTKVARSVELQRKSGSKWVRIANGRTSSTGRYSFSASSSVSTAQLRVYAPKTKIGKKTYSKITSKVSTVRTVLVNPSSPMPGETFTVVESLGKKGARPASLQRKSGRSWITLQTVKTSSAGTATFSTSLSASASLRVYAPKTKIKKKTYSKITVATFQVAISAQSGTLSLPSTGITGQALVAETQFAPARAGRTVELQQLSGADWVTVATGTQDATGKATLGAAPSTEGTLTYRAVATAYQGAPAVSTSTSQATIASGVAEPSIVIGTLDPAVTGDNYRSSLTVVGGTAPFTWTATGLPDGMSLSEDGVLSGTPITPGTYDVTISLTDSRGKTTQTTTTITVLPPVGIDSTQLPDGIAGQDYTASLTASGGTQPYHWTAEGLPSGLTLSDDGVITGTAGAAGEVTVTVTVTDDNGKTASKELTLTLGAALALTTTELPSGTVGTDYTATLTATGGASPYTWSQTGLPNGLSLNETTGVISGAPTQAGTFDAVTLTVTDDNGYAETATVTVVIAAVFAISTASLPGGVVGTAYTDTTLATVAGTGPFTWSSTTLPAGLSLDTTTGVISGTPTESGTFDAVTIAVSDSTGKTAESTFSIAIAPAVIIDKLTLPDGVVGTDYPETTLTASYGNSASYTWSSTTLPAGLTLSSSGIITGTPTESGTFDAVTITVADADGKTAEATVSLTIAPAVIIDKFTLPDGVVGTDYPETTLTASYGNSASYTWSSSTLPAGLTLSSSGTITGTPTESGTFDAVTITVADADGKTAEATVSLTIAPALHITTTSLPAGVVDTAYAETTLSAADGNSASYTWSSTTLPAGLSLSEAGVLTGTPTADGTTDITVTVTDAAGKTATAELSITIAKAVHITTASLPAGVVGTDYPETTLTAADGHSGSYFWVADHLPDGLSFNGNTGVLSGVPTAAGTFDTVTFTVTDEAGKTAEATFTITIAPAVHITTTTLPDGVVGTAYTTTTLTAADGNSDSYSWASTTLPDGLTLSSSGKITGTPTSSGVYENVTITVTDGDGKTAEATFTVTIAQAVHITTASLPTGVVGTDYPDTTLAAVDGTGPYSWSSTTLPDGLTLSTAGVLSGTPTASGTFDSITVTVTDANSKTAEATFTITITPAVHITTASLPAGVVGTDYTATLTGADGASPYTWASTPLPAGLTLSEAGTITGVPTEAGTFDAVKVTATDANSKTAEATFTVTIAPAVHITTASLPAGVVGTDYPDTTLAAADGNSATYTWTSTTLPDGLSLSSTGVITGTPTSSGVYDAVKLTVADADGKTAEATFTITVAPAVHMTTTSLPAGVVGTDYPDTTLEAADGNGSPYTWSSTGLPSGLTLSEAGTITGTPTTAGTFDAVTITVTDNNGKTAAATFTVEIIPGVQITTASLPAGVVGTTYPDTTLTATNGTGPYTWNSTTLPAGLSLSEAGTITGTPTAAGTFTVAITATDAQGKHAYADFDVVVAPAVAVSTSSLPFGVVGTNYTATITATGGTPGYTWQVAMLPAGLSLNTATGEITGVPTGPTTTWVAFTVTDGAGKTAYREIALTVKPAVHITTSSLPVAVVGTAYTATLAAADGTGPYTWSASGLPMALTLSADGTLTGTLDSAGILDEITITATDTNGKTATFAPVLTVIPAVHITTTTLPTGVVGTAYEATLTAADGTAGYTWTAASLPSGLHLSEAGVISGTPSEAGATWVAFTVTDNNGKTHTQDLQLVVTPAVHITTTALPDAVMDEAYPETTLAAADGTAPYTWAATGLPTGVSLNNTTGALSGTPTESGTFEVGFTVTDANHKTATSTLSTTVHGVVAVTTAALPDAVVGETYTTTVSGLGGTLPYTWAIADLPEGVTFNATTGEISGTATTAGSYEVDVTLTDSHLKTATATLTLTVRPRVDITTASLASGVVDTAFNATLSASGGTAPYSWSASNLPLGLSVDTAGQISGNPTTAGTGWATFTVTDAHGKTDILDISMTIIPAVHITTTSLPTGFVGTAYSTTLAAADGNGAATWSADTLPAGLSLDADTGKLTGTPQASGATTITFTATDPQDKTATWQTSLQIVPAVHVTSTDLPAGVVGTDYTANLTAADGNAPLTWTATDLPAGLSLDSDTGVISGTPTAAGTTEVTFTAHDQDAKADDWTFSMVIVPTVHITTDSLPSVEAGDAYPSTTLTAADGTPGYTWTSTALPEGLTLSEAGVLTGTPTTDATTAVTFTATDHNGKTATAELSITITAAAHVTSTLAIGVVGGDYTTTLTADGGTAPYTYTAASLPAGLTLTDGVLSGTPTVSGTNTPVEFTVTDGRGKTSTASLGLTVVQPKTEAAGLNHTCAITPSGAVECWGNNSAGQLGAATETAFQTYPVRVSGLSGPAISVSAGGSQSCAVLKNGEIQCWGANTVGQLGAGDNTAHPVPVTVVGITSAVSVAAGSNFTCATMANGTAACWGMGASGQIGNGSSTTVYGPASVKNLTNVADVEVGGYHACALTTTGSVSCWGRNNTRQLGAGADAATSTANTPVTVPDVSGVTSLSAHLGNHTCVTEDSGAVKCWGNNGSFQLGTTSPVSSGAALTVPGITDAVLALAGGTHSCVVTSAGIASCWGSDLYGQLGDGTTGSNSSSPILVSNLTDAVTSASLGSSHSCVRTSTGDVVCWGANSGGQLGNGLSSTTVTPLAVPTLTQVSQVSAGSSTTCAVVNGGAKCWGNNGNGQLGNNSTIPSANPVDVSGLTTGVTQVGVGQDFACALTTGGAVKCWGKNTSGQLGNGSQNDSPTPVDVQGLSSGVAKITVGYQHVCALTTDGAVKCWGFNGNGQLGDDSSATRVVPVDAYGLSSGVVDVGAGQAHTCAVLSGGTLDCWGNNGSGELGLGNVGGATPIPTAVDGLSAVTAVSAGQGYTCALATDGTAKCWGSNSFGQLGDGTNTNHASPAAVRELSGATSLSAGLFHACVVDGGSGVQCWGYNGSGQLGDGTLANQPAPTAVHGLTGIRAVASGYTHTCALTNSGALFCWGTNTSGELGQTTAYNATPTPVIGVDAAELVATSITLDAGVVGTAYPSRDLSASGGVAPYTWTATGLPAGLSLSPDGALSGTPTEAGTSEVTFTATDVRGKKDSTTASITIVPAVHITTDTLPNGAVGAAYEVQLEAADGSGGFTWSGVTLPAGLSLSSSGVLSGTPTTQSASAPVQVTVTDAGGATATQTFRIQITSPIQAVAMVAKGGSGNSCALTSNGGVECWGLNDHGQLGNGTTTNAVSPAPVSGLSSGVVSVVSGGSHSCALTTSGGVKCWGRNNLGQVGNQTFDDQHSPVDVFGLTSGVIAIGAGVNHSCAVLTTGAVTCWGYNPAGQLGDGTLTNSNVPVATAITSGATQVVGGAAFTCVLVGGGVKCWGNSTYGQLGDGTGTSSLTPVAVSGLTSGVASLSAYAQGACVVTNAGGAKCWGLNGTGQLGNGTTNNALAPVDVTGLSSGVTQVAVGSTHACALTTAGAVTCWGNNNNGQLGDGTLNNSTTPVASGLSSGVRRVSAGAQRSCAVLTTGGLTCWGAGESGQLGDGSTPVNNPNPVDVFGYGATPVSITTTSVPSGAVGSAYPGPTLAATGGTGPYTWTAWGLPTGLSLSSAGVLSGTPTAVGSWPDVTVWVADSAGNRSATTFIITVSPALAISTSSLADGLVNSTYANPAMAATGGNGAYSWSATNLPSGLSLDADAGTITGTPTAYGVFSVAITATDQSGYAATTTIPLTVLAIAGVASDFIAMDAGANQACAVNNVGGVECWGNNALGQLGDGTTTLSLAPVKVSGLSSGATSVTTGNNSSCALTSAGGVKCWGNNNYGQLGNNSTTTSTTPVDVTGLTSGVTAITTGNNFACALTSAGGVKCWGYNVYGQLGNDSTTASSTPVDVAGLTSGVTAITAGANYTCAVVSGGVKCWGYNGYGQLGNNSTTDAHTPVDVTGLTSGVTAIASGALYTCAVVSGGVKCWGYNGYGQLGDNSTTDAHTPVDVTSLTSGVTAVTAGNYHTCALTTTGALKCWGNNAYGQLGNNTSIDSHTPVNVTGLTSGATAVTAGANNTCALTSGHDVACWGVNTLGQLGNGQRSQVLSPVTPTGLGSGVTATAAGYNHTCAVTSGGGVQCWGENAVGTLGDGTTTTTSTPVGVRGLTSGVSAVTSGGGFACALTTGGGVKCWGGNTNGQLGNNATTTSTFPVDVTGLTSGVAAISAGGTHVCALTTTGGVKCWGNNFAGAVGDSSTSDRYTPVNVTGLTSGVAAISAGGSHTCALTTTGGVKCWGYNEAGELGNGTTTASSTPVDVTGLTSGVTAIDAGGSQTCAVTTTGGVKCWGYNNNGQLGNGTTTDSYTPVDVTGLTSGVAGISVGAYHACALTTAGGMKCWGQDSYGQLGDGTTTTHTTAVDVTGLSSGVATISAGKQHTCATTTSGALKCWGSNVVGQVGNGDVITLVPGAVVGHTFTPTTGALSITTASLSSGTVSSTYSSAALAGTGGVGPYSWSATNVPAGITLSSAGVWGGTPTTAGSTNVTITVTDANANTVSTTFSLTINSALAITTSSLSAGTVGTAYSSTAMAATGGTGTYTWTATGVPSGITLSSAGVWGGAPTAAGAPSVTITATDTAGNTVSKSLTLSVTAALSITTSSLSGGIQGSPYSGPNMAATGGTSPYTWSASGLPSGISLSSTGVWGGTCPEYITSWSGVTVTVTDSAGRKATRSYTMFFQAPAGG